MWISVEQPFNFKSMTYGLFNWVIEMLFCNVCICFPPSFRKSNSSDYKLRPFLSVVISVYIASIVFGLDSNDTILNNKNVVDLCCSSFCFKHNVT